MRVSLRCDPCAIFGSTITGDAVVLCRLSPSVVSGAFALRRIGCTTCATQGFLQAYPLPGSRKTRGQLVSASFPAQDRLFQASAVRIRRKRRLARISVNDHFDDLGGQEPMVDAVETIRCMHRRQMKRGFRIPEPSFALLCSTSPAERGWFALI
jgi:hypothetical protein